MQCELCSRSSELAELILQLIKGILIQGGREGGRERRGGSLLLRNQYTRRRHAAGCRPMPSCLTLLPSHQLSGCQPACQSASGHGRVPL